VGRGKAVTYEFVESDKDISDEDLQELRRLSRELDENPQHACIVSVLMLREGWDIRNVTTIVPLRPLTSKSDILPEQTLGRGLRRMTPPGQASEILTVVEHKAFASLYQQELSQQGVEIEVVEVDKVPRTTVAIFPDEKKPSFGEMEIALPTVSEEYRIVAELGDLTLDDCPTGSSRQNSRRGWQSSSACSGAVLRVNCSPHTRHSSSPQLRTANTFPIWSRWELPRLRFVFSLGMSLHPALFCFNWYRGIFVAVHLFHQPTDACPRDAVLLRDLRQAHAGAAVINHLLTIHIKPRSADLTTFQPRPAHTCTYSFDQDAPLQFRHCADYDENRPAQRTLGVYRLALAQELDAHAVQFVDGLEQMLRRTRQPVARPDKQHVELVSSGIVHHPVEFRASRSRARESVVGVLAHDLEAIGGELPKLAELRLWVLVNRSKHGNTVRLVSSAQFSFGWSACLAKSIRSHETNGRFGSEQV
jgi:hypothetical protein